MPIIRGYEEVGDSRTTLGYYSAGLRGKRYYYHPSVENDRKRAKKKAKKQLKAMHTGYYQKDLKEMSKEQRRLMREKYK